MLAADAAKRHCHVRDVVAILLKEPSLTGDLSWQVIQTPQQLTLVVIPDPSTALLLIAGGLSHRLRRSRVYRTTNGN